MASTNFQTNTMTFRQLFGNGTTYAIPPFQRDYSWSSDEWEDLWQDLQAAFNEDGDASHYMGYLVLREVSPKEFEVIDGQQRLTTITVIVLAALNQLKRLANDAGDEGRSEKRSDALRQSYVGYLDPVSLLPRSKLKLNRNNDQFFQSWLVALREPLPARGLKASEKRLRDAYTFFDKKMSDLLRGHADKGAALAQFIDQMSLTLVFTVITVTNELNAYTVFETLNARGVKLSSTDLLKNYLFSVLHRGDADPIELARLEERWERILGDLENESFPVFVRAHWMSRNGLIRESELFKTIRNKVTDRASAFALLAGMEDDVQVYLALSKPEVSGWSAEDRNAAIHLRLFNVRQPFPILMAARRRLPPAEFTTFIKAMVNLTFRFSVVANGQSSDLESAFSAEAARIDRGETTSARQAIINLRPVYILDDRFHLDFADITFDTTKTAKRKLVRYIFSKLEVQAGGAPLNIEDETVTIEHICPTNPDLGWDQFTPVEVEALSPRLGNLTLLHRGANNAQGNTAYAEKVPDYRNSAFILTRRLPDSYPEWTPATVEARQSSLARTASGIWRIAQLDEP